MALQEQHTRRRRQRDEQTELKKKTEIETSEKGRRQREQREQRRQAFDQKFAQDGNRVMTFEQWCLLNAFSTATGRRIVERGEGPVVVQLSPRRIGVRNADNRAWQASRARG